MNSLSLSFAIIISITGSAVRGLRDVVISVPPAVREGDPASLNCSFQLDGDALYTVKWYKSGREFFRFTPKETPPMKIFPTHGLRITDIEKEKSGMNSVTLREVYEPMAGTYSCEVSADAPSFHTAMVSGLMTVVLVPKGNPVLSGLRSRYKQGEVMSANCTSTGSKPAANITWVLNGKHVDRRYVRLYREVTVNDLETSISRIDQPLKPSLFESGRLKLKCMVSIYNVYWKTTEKSVELAERPRSDHPNQAYPAYDQDPRKINPVYNSKPQEHGSMKNSGVRWSLTLGSVLTVLKMLMRT